MSHIGRAVLDVAARMLVWSLFRVDAQGVEEVPDRGPLILVSNHIHALELPVLRVLLRPRVVRTLAKAESWDHRLLGWVMDQWHAIPVRRGEADLAALRSALRTLSDGGLLGIMPEGTRSGDGRLQRANPGVGLIAQKAACPILPVAFWGVENVGAALRRGRRCVFHLRVGRPFTLAPPLGKPAREDHQRSADHMMHRVAELMPTRYHGVYQGMVREPGNPPAEEGRIPQT